MILVGAVILSIFLSLLATTPTYYRHVSLAAHDADFSSRGALNDQAGVSDMARFDLRAPSLLDGIAGVSQLLLDPGIMELRVTGIGPDGESAVTLMADGFRHRVRMVFIA